MARKMRDSGVEWIGEVPEGWEVNLIGTFYSQRSEKVSDRDYAPLSVTMKRRTIGILKSSTEPSASVTTSRRSSQGSRECS